MGILSWISGNGKEESAPPPQQAVIVYFDYGSTDFAPLFDLLDRLEALVDERAVGEVDGHEVATDGTDGSLYMYGPDADALFAVVRPVLESIAFMKGARVKLRYGPPEDGVREQQVVLGS